MKAPGVRNGGNDFARSSPGYLFVFFSGKQACNHITKTVTDQQIYLLRAGFGAAGTAGAD
jgi:hypothetical protein